MQAYPETIVCKFGRDRVICLGKEAIFVPAQKCPYHVTFDLDLEHTLDAGLPGDHRASLVAIGSFAWEKKRFSCQHKSARIT